jgi:hypothetical protein
MSNFMPVCNLQYARGPRHPRTRKLPWNYSFGMPTHFVHPKLRTRRVWNHRQTQEGAEFGLATSTRDAERLRHSQANQMILRG